VQNEITVFGSIAHTHYHGIKTSARIIRNGKEIDYMNHNNYYTGRKQNYAFMKPVTLKKVCKNTILSCLYWKILKLPFFVNERVIK
jgi:hypothetical protein